MRVEFVGHLIPDSLVKGVERLAADKGPKRFAKEIASELEIEKIIVLTLVKQRVGQRALIRIDAPGRSTPRRWYAKLRRKTGGGDREGRAFLTRISEEARKVGVEIPRPIAYLPHYRATIYTAAFGKPLLPCCAPRDDADCDSSDLPSSSRDRGLIFHEVGRALASLHETLPRPEVVRQDLFESEQIDRARKSLVEHRPDLTGRFDAAVRIWWNDRPPPRGPGHGETVTLHGDLYPSQVLIGRPDGSPRPTIAFLDWDNLCAGDAERDVANFLVHIDLELHRRHLEPLERTSLVTSFHKGYRSLHPIDDARFNWYRRATSLRLASLYAAPNFGPCTPNRPDLAERLLADA